MNEIFENQKEKFDNIKESARNLGVEDKPKQESAPVFVAKRNCKRCWGKGVVVFQAANETEPRGVFCKCVKKVELDA